MEVSIGYSYSVARPHFRVILLLTTYILHIEQLLLVIHSNLCCGLSIWYILILQTITERR